MGYVKLNQGRFSKEILVRGEEYEEMGNVSINGFTGSQVTAIVDGTFPYEVRVEFAKDGHMLRHSCTCPYHAKGKCCKHIAAVLFALDNLPDGKFIKPYPLEETKTQSSPFQYASGWLLADFQKKSIEEFAKIIDESDDAFVEDVRMFLRAASSQYGYGRYKENADTYYKVFASLLPNERKAKLFFNTINARILSNSIFSIFFAKALYSTTTREIANDLLVNVHNIVHERINGDFISALNPVNIFAFLNHEALKLFAADFYFPYESDEAMFIDACDEAEAYDALEILLKRTRLGRNPSAKRILDILNRNNGSEGAFQNLLISFQTGAIPFADVLEAYFKLEEDEQQAVIDEFIDVCSFKPEYLATLNVISSKHVMSNEVATIPMDCLRYVYDIIEEKGEDFINKALPRKIEKEIKRCVSAYNDEKSFDEILSLIKRFAKYPLIVNYLRGQTLLDLSKHSPTMRRRYIEVVESLGLLKSNGIYPFHEVGLCY